MKWNERTFEEKVEYFAQQINEWKNKTKGYEVKELQSISHTTSNMRLHLMVKTMAREKHLTSTAGI